MAADRPSTSGGVPTTRDNNFATNKRMSKDDMSLMLGDHSRRTAMARQLQNMPNNRMSRDDMYIRSRMAAMSQFHVPVRGSTITPEHSPDYPGAREVSIPVRMQTPESINSIVTSGEIQIGMALGSPARTLPPDPSRWQAQFPPASPHPTDRSPAPSPAMGEPAGAGSLQRKKTGRRKLFGLFGGGRKNAEPTDEDGSAQRDRGLSIITKAPTAMQSTVSVVPKTPRTPTRSNTQADRKAPKHKPIMVRSATLPHGSNAAPAPQPKSAGLSGFRSNSSQRAGPSDQQQPPSVPPIPRLNVTIPDTRLERYSVMFSDVLQGPRHEPAASLLARRQATLERLKTINDTVEAQIQEYHAERPERTRRATSPHPAPEPRSQYALQQPRLRLQEPTASPRLSIFPVPPTNRTVVVDSPSSHTRVARSNTSPGRLPSPTQQTFNARRGPPPQAKGTAQRLEVPNPFEMNPPDPRPRPKAQEPIYPTDTSFHFGPDQSGLILDSPTSIDLREDIVVTQPSKPTLHEPQWQMISPSTASSSAASARRGRSPSAASNSTHVTKPSSEFDPADAALQNAVEVSIARQISISRQQRQLLRPLQTRRGTTGDGRPTAGGGGGGGERGPASATEGRSPLGVTVIKAPSPNRLGRDESIKEVQSSTPTLVHSRQFPPAEHRKSSWVVLDSD